MKTRISVVSFVLAVVLTTGIAFAGSPASVSKSSSAIVELNLIAGVETMNEGVQVGSAYYLGEMKSAKAVLPLMKLLHEGKTDGVRISAAAALIKIGDSRGVFAVKQCGRFDSNESVRRMCANLYAYYMKHPKQ